MLPDVVAVCGQELGPGRKSGVLKSELAAQPVSGAKVPTKETPKTALLLTGDGHGTAASPKAKSRPSQGQQAELKFLVSSSLVNLANVRKCGRKPRFLFVLQLLHQGGMVS